MFPHYLAMGMSPEEYWDGESSLKPAYRKAFRIRMENDERIADRNAWLLGLYVRDALQSVAMLVNGFVPKGVEVGKYPEKPMLEKAEDEKKQEVQKQKEEDQMKVAMAMFQAMANKFNRNFEKRQDGQAVKT